MNTSSLKLLPFRKGKLQSKWINVKVSINVQGEVDNKDFPSEYLTVETVRRKLEEYKLFENNIVSIHMSPLRTTQDHFYPQEAKLMLIELLKKPSTSDFETYYETPFQTLKWVIEMVEQPYSTQHNNPPAWYRENFGHVYAHSILKVYGLSLFPSYSNRFLRIKRRRRTQSTKTIPSLKMTSKNPTPKRQELMTSKHPIPKRQ